MGSGGSNALWSSGKAVCCLVGFISKYSFEYHHSTNKVMDEEVVVLYLLYQRK